MNGIGWAIQKLKCEGKVCRSSGGGGRFLVMVDAYPTGIPVTEYTKRILGDDLEIGYTPFILEMGFDGVLRPWFPSHDDLFAEDWKEV